MKGRFFRNDELRDSHDMRMDALALKVSSILNGEKCFDAACVCALLAAFGLATDTHFGSGKAPRGLQPCAQLYAPENNRSEFINVYVKPGQPPKFDADRKAANKLTDALWVDLLQQIWNMHPAPVAWVLTGAPGSRRVTRTVDTWPE
jgi:hypothetical protein